MSRIPSQPTQDEQIRHLQEQVRRLWTRLRSAGGSDPVEGFTSITAYLRPGWYDYDQNAGFYLDRERVFFRGVIGLDTSIAGATPNQILSSLPVGYRPTTTNAHVPLPTDANSTVAGTADTIFPGVFVFSGALNVNVHPSFGAAPNFGAPPNGTVIDLETLSFRIN